MDKKATAGWERVGDRYYRKLQLYSAVFDEDVDLGDYMIAGAPYGGALALFRNQDKVYSYRGSASSQSAIDIYSCAGRLLKRINWDKSPIRGLGWSEEETLIVVSQDGIVSCYARLTDDFTPFSLGHGADEHGVASCKFWAGGFVALLGNNQLIAVSNIEEPKPKLLALPPSGSIISWAIIPPAYTDSRSVEVLLSIGQTINVVDASESEDRMLQNGPFRLIAVSPNGRFIALYTDDGKVWVISSDFQDKLSEYDTRIKTPPKDMQWCGNDAVVLAWDDELHLLGPNGASSKYFYDSWIHLVPDVDGVRIITNESHELLQKVPDATEETFKLGANSASSILLDAIEHVDRLSPKADDNIQLIKHNLIDAVNTCVDAASHEFNPHWQRKLLKAASFGKTILQQFDSDGFLDTCETVRVLNDVRNFEIGLPLSYDQYIRLNPERLVLRLINRQEYPLALKISEYLHLPTDVIYTHWASSTVRTSSADDDTVCSRIVAKLSKQRGVDFSTIARAAHDEGRQHLATQLLNYETDAGKQVPLLMSMEEDTLALDKAIESGDTDLVLYALGHLRRKLPLASFFRTINKRPVASALVESTARDQDRELLRDFYYQDDRRLDGSNLLFTDALSQPGTNSKTEKLKLAAKLVHDSKELTFQNRAIEETARLLKIQESLDSDPSLAENLPPSSAAENEDQTRRQFTGLTLYATISRLIEMHATKRAQKLSNDFTVPERSFWHLQLQALIGMRAWQQLQQIAEHNKKSPIGWEIFFNEVLAAGNTGLAGKVFVPKCTNLTPQERSDMYVKCGLIARAVEEAVKAKDNKLVEELRGKAVGNEALEVERIIKASKR